MRTGILNNLAAALSQSYISTAALDRLSDNNPDQDVLEVLRDIYDNLERLHKDQQTIQRLLADLKNTLESEL